MSFSTFFRIMGVTSSLNHHFRVKCLLVTVGQVPVKRVQIILPQAGFSCTEKCFGLFPRNTSPSLVSPAAATFAFNPGSDKSVFAPFWTQSDLHCHRFPYFQIPYWLHFLDASFAYRRPPRPFLRSFYSSLCAAPQ